jgi:hypothetical protein
VRKQEEEKEGWYKFSWRQEWCPIQGFLENRRNWPTKGRAERRSLERKREGKRERLWKIEEGSESLKKRETQSNLHSTLQKKKRTRKREKIEEWREQGGKGRGEENKRRRKHKHFFEMSMSEGVGAARTLCILDQLGGNCRNSRLLIAPDHLIVYVEASKGSRFLE